LFDIHIDAIVELLLILARGIQKSAQCGFAHAWQANWDKEELIDIIHFLL
jgi:hypothetical protein